LWAVTQTSPWRAQSFDQRLLMPPAQTEKTSPVHVSVGGLLLSQVKFELPLLRQVAIALQSLLAIAWSRQARMSRGTNGMVPGPGPLALQIERLWTTPPVV
jgi:hypothetical protein